MEGSAPVVGRLAPSPTGAQHVGNARTYLLAWLLARSQRGSVILRIEDIDSPRVKLGAAAQAVEDLRWLGLDWDEGPDRAGPHAPYVQTERLPRYAQALAELMQAERVYPCTCTRSDVAAAASAPHLGQEGPRYGGACAGRKVADAQPLLDASIPFCWRLRTTSERRTLCDLIAKEQSCSVHADLGDFVVAKADGLPAYQLAVVVDDHDMGVTQVLRGNDLLPSAFRQLEIYDFFGWHPPSFAHVPLVVGPDGRRLAKRHGDTRLALLRDRGVLPERLIGYLAWSCGLQSNQWPAKAHELAPQFSLASLPPQPVVFTTETLASLIAGP